MGACKRPWAWSASDGRSWPMPCGRCLACRIRRRSIWAIRMLHEITTAHRACFITLTYSDEHLPRRGSDSRGILVKSDLQKFFKRLRKAGYEFKYYACGEYGDIGSRPHYHAILFGVELQREALEEAWTMGICDSGTATERSVKYVAGYVAKKLGLSEYLNDNRPAPFQVCSQGIGLEWAKENMIEAMLQGGLVLKGKKLPIPRAYKDWYEEIFPDAVAGFSARQQWESDLALSDLILELLPDAGGLSWSELSDEVRENVMIQLHKRGSMIDANLRAAANMKEKESKL